MALLRAAPRRGASPLHGHRRAELDLPIVRLAERSERLLPQPDGDESGRGGDDPRRAARASGRIRDPGEPDREQDKQDAEGRPPAAGHGAGV